MFKNAVSGPCSAWRRRRQRLGQALPYLFDELLVLRVEKDAEGAPSRWLQTGADLQYVAKDRSGTLDQYELPDLSAIAAKILQPTEGN